MPNTKIHQIALDEVNSTIAEFLETGFFRETNWLERKERGEVIPEITLRKIARGVAKELGRPFSLWTNCLDTHEWQGRWVLRPTPVAYGGYVSVPKKKGLEVVVAPLLLVAVSGERYTRAGKTPPDVVIHEMVSRWSIRVNKEDLWQAYKQYVRDTPEVRAALKLDNPAG